MREEVNSLRQQKESFIARLRHLLTSQIELLEVLDMDDKSIAEIKDRTKKVFSASNKTKTKAVETPKPQSEQIKIETTVGEAVKQDSAKKGHDFFNDIFKDEKK